MGWDRVVLASYGTPYVLTVPGSLLADAHPSLPAVGSRATTVGRGLFRLGTLSGCGVLGLANVAPITLTPAMAIWYDASLGSPAGGFDASI
jgi:hypothetical protein